MRKTHTSQADKYVEAILIFTEWDLPNLKRIKQKEELKMSKRLMHSFKKYPRFFFITALTLIGCLVPITQAKADDPLPFTSNVNFDRQLSTRQFIVTNRRVCLSSRVSQVYTARLLLYTPVGGINVGDPVRVPAVRGSDPDFIRCWEGISNGENYFFSFSKSTQTPNATGRVTVFER